MTVHDLYNGIHTVSRRKGINSVLGFVSKLAFHRNVRTATVLSCSTKCYGGHRYGSVATH